MNSKNFVLISLGANVNRQQQMVRAKERLKEVFPDITFTRIIDTPDCLTGERMYSNCLARLLTELSEEQLKETFSCMEKELGRSEAEKDNILMDIDILQYGQQKRHLEDWTRPYVKALMTLLCCFLIAFTTFAADRSKETQSKATEELTKATEYFQGGKYHEAILSFAKLQRKYTLTTRYQAYLGFAYYKDRDYEQAAKTLQPILDKITMFAPKEQAVYLYACGESLFNLGQYQQSIEVYEKALPLVEGNDRADVLFHTAFAHYLLGDAKETYVPLFIETKDILSVNATDELHKARKKQVEIMLPGMK